ncbi:MAG TPA: hypothetical protein VHM01_08985 [Alphaproteobacteria bacterium]|nr:hypothetical protein [Alphaproteobacteria bacterium]
MSYPQAILGAAALLAAAIAFAASTGPHAAEGGGFEGVSSSRTAPAGAASGDMIWRVNKQSGAVSICYGHNTREAPSCSPWSK